MTRALNESLFPREISELLKTLSEAGFFERSLLIGSWVMPVYKELHGVAYTLRTLDVDFAVHVAHPRTQLRADLESLITGIGFSSFLGAEGVQKFSAGGYEVEFMVHRRGGRSGGVRKLEEWKLNALPLPFIDILLDFAETAILGTSKCASQFQNPTSCTSSSSLPDDPWQPSGSRTWSSALRSCLPCATGNSGTSWLRGGWGRQRCGVSPHRAPRLTFRYIASGWIDP